MISGFSNRDSCGNPTPNFRVFNGKSSNQTPFDTKKKSIPKDGLISKKP